MSRASPDGPFTVRVSFAEVGGDGFRLSDSLAALRGAPQGVSAASDPPAALHGALALHCDVWRRNQRRFLECYFAFVERHLADHRDELLERLERFGRLYDADDWIYSALMPLPRAFLHAPEGGAAFGPKTLVPVDFAFWIGAAAIAIELPGKNTRPAATDRRHARLRQAGHRVLELSADALDPARFDTEMPDDLRHFWRGRALPTGPLKPAALDVKIDEI